MSYLALARKWRPKTFSQLLGQEHVCKGLKNALDQQRIHHAYLFTGTRGVGKTSVARLLAKSLNCERGVSAEPCLQCESCLAIEQGHFIDLIEVDAASKTGVEDTRALLDNVQYAPSSGRYKIYLIDEVHMLSQHSFNALLKTLEEPPAHVKFLLATTDPQKLPATILSRCLQFNLRHLPDAIIQQHLAYILNEEQLAFEPEAITIVARAAKGSMRDSLSILDQVINGSDGQILASDVKKLLGYTQQNYAYDLLQALAKQDPGRIYNDCQAIAAESGHFHYVLDEVMEKLHQIALCQTLQQGKTENLLNFDAETLSLAACFSPEDVQLFYQIALKGREEMHLAPSQAIGFEMTLLRMLAFRPAPEATKVTMAWPTTKGLIPETEEVSTAPEVDVQKPASSAITKAEPPAPIPETKQAAQNPVENSAVNKTSGSTWPEILTALKLRGLTQNAAENAALLSHDAGQVTLGIKKNHRSLFTPSVLMRLEEALSRYYQKKITITLEDDKTDAPDSPAAMKQRVQEESQKSAEEKLDQDTVLQTLKESFSAKMVKNSVTPLEDGL